MINTENYGTLFSLQPEAICDNQDCLNAFGSLYADCGREDFRDAIFNCKISYTLFLLHLLLQRQYYKSLISC